MILYTIALLCGLLHISHGQVSIGVNSVELELGHMGQAAVEDGKLIAKLGDEIYIKCIYDNFNHPKQILSLQHEDEGESNRRLIMVPGTISSPWRESPEKYVGDFQWNTFPYYSSFNISGISLVDDGQYLCVVTENNNVVHSSVAAVEVHVNTENVTLEGVKDGKYETFADKIQVICTAYNGSKPNMTLIVGDERIPFDSVERKEGEEDQYEGNLSYRFKVSQNKQDIKCEAVVPGYENQAVTDSADLVIYASPEIKCPDSVTGKKDDKVVITCTISGDQLPTLEQINWRTPIGNIGGEDDSSSQIGLTSTVTLINNGTKYEVKLSVKIMDNQPYGTYILVATNAGGTETLSVKLNTPDTKKMDTVTDKDVRAGSNSIVASLLTLLMASFCFSL